MKITVENLEKLEYRPKRYDWKDKHSNYYIYKDACKNCGDPFLARKGSKGWFCDKSCANTGKNNPRYEICDEAKNYPNYKGGVIEKNIPLYDTYAYQIDFCEKVRKNKEDLNILEVKCAYCGKWYIPTRIDVIRRIQVLNGNYQGESRLYCSEQCKQECPIFWQQKWPKEFKQATSREVQPELRQMCLKRDDYTCQICGLTQDELEVGLHCHHLEGIRHNPLESADLDMVITLCKNCHKQVHTLPGCGYQDMKCEER